MGKPILLLLCIFLTACSKSDDIPFSEQAYSLSASINGKSFESQGFGDILAQYRKLDDGTHQFVMLGSTDSDSSGNYERMVISAWTTPSTTFERGFAVADSKNSRTVNPYAYYEEVNRDSDVITVHADNRITRISSFAITELNTQEKWMSGTFSFTGYDTALEKFYEVKQGVFKNVEYEELAANEP